MAEVTVFVDDAVRGRLPMTCVKDGTAAGGMLTVSTPVGDGARTGALWLLLLLGPLGWIALAFLLTSRSSRAETLVIEVPYSEAAFERLVAVRARYARLRWIGAAVAAVVVVGLVAQALPVAAYAVALASFVGLIVVAAWHRDREHRAGIDVELDASRRWVRLRGVHPAFADACDDADHDATTRRP